MAKRIHAGERWVGKDDVRWRWEKCVSKEAAEDAKVQMVEGRRDKEGEYAPPPGKMSISDEVGRKGSVCVIIHFGANQSAANRESTKPKKIFL